MWFRYKHLTGANIVYKKLIENNVEKVFTYSGGAIMSLIDTLHSSHNNKIKYYINTHEQSAGHAATAYGRLTGKPGVCIMTSGPGVTNSVTPLTDATNDSTPLILITGNVSLDSIGTNAFQECPATEITKSITKWNYLVKNVHEIPSVIDEAFRVSTNGKPGSVHIDIPKCVLNHTYMFNYGVIKQRYKNYENPKINTRVSIHASLNKIIHLLNIAKRPLIIAGHGCNRAENIYKLKSFAFRGNIPVTTTIHGLGIFDEMNPLSLEFHGMHGSVAANYAIQEADLIIALGSRFDDRTTGNIKKYAPEAYKAFERNEGGIVHVNVNSKELSSATETHYNYHMDCGTFLDSVIPFFRARTEWFKKLKQWKQKYPFKYSGGKLMTQDVISEINNYLLNKKVEDYIITTGVGNHQMMACQYIKWRYPRSLVTSGSLGVMGVGLPFAIGSQIAHPEKLVIDIDGDGSFNHTLSELKTVMNYGLPIKIAILNDTCLSMVNTWEKLFYEERYTATDLNKNPDYVKLAESYGIKSIYCDSKEDLESKIDEFLSYDDAILCEFKVKSDQCYPLVPPGAALNEMMLSNDNNDNDNNNDNKIKKNMLAPC